MPQIPIRLRAPQRLGEVPRWFAAGGTGLGSWAHGQAPIALHVARRYMNMNRSVQTRWELDNQSISSKRTDYDFDKEQWMKQMKFASMDCIMDPDISPIRLTSFSGAKKAFRRWLTMRKLYERRSDFKPEQLQELFKEYKKASHTRDQHVLKVLQRLTTHGEADRIAKEIRAQMNEDFSKKSWKALKMQSMTNAFDIEIDAFELVTCYLGQMARDDWMQMTYKCEYRERLSPADEWAKVVEYPVFEVRLGDGVSTANVFPFIVVAVMRKDGTRYGKDSQDAQALRKQFDRSGKWF